MQIMQRTRKHLLAVASAAVLGLSLVACGGGPSGGGSKGGDIVFRTFDPPAEAAGLRKAVDDWNGTHEVKVKLETVAIADALAQYTREVNSRSGPDVSQMAFVWVRDLAKAGLVKDLTPYVQKDAPGRGINDFLGLDINQLDGKTYGVPWTVDTYALAYSPKALKEAGADAIPTDWNEFATLARKLTTPGRAGFCFAASSAPTADVWHLFNYYLWSKGESLVTADGRLGVDTAQVQDAFSYLNAFFANGTTPASMISIDNAGDPAINSALAKGSCAIAFMSPAQFKVALATDPSLVTASVPTGTAGAPTTHLGGRSLAINPNSRNADAAWQFVKFLTSEKVFTDYYTGQFPAQSSVVRKLSFGPALVGFQKELPTARTYSMYINSAAPTSKYQGLTNQTLGAIFSGQATPASAATGYIAAVKELTKR